MSAARHALCDVQAVVQQRGGQDHVWRHELAVTHGDALPLSDAALAEPCFVVRVLLSHTTAFSATPSILRGRDGLAFILK